MHFRPTPGRPRIGLSPTPEDRVPTDLVKQTDLGPTLGKPKPTPDRPRFGTAPGESRTDIYLLDIIFLGHGTELPMGSRGRSAYGPHFLQDGPTLSRSRTDLGPVLGPPRRNPVRSTDLGSAPDRTREAGRPWTDRLRDDLEKQTGPTPSPKKISVNCLSLAYDSAREVLCVGPRRALIYTGADPGRIQDRSWPRPVGSRHSIPT